MARQLRRTDKKRQKLIIVQAPAPARSGRFQQIALLQPPHQRKVSREHHESHARQIRSLQPPLLPTAAQERQKTELVARAVIDAHRVAQTGQQIAAQLLRQPSQRPLPQPRHQRSKRRVAKTRHCLLGLHLLHRRLHLCQHVHQALHVGGRYRSRHLRRRLACGRSAQIDQKRHEAAKRHRVAEARHDLVLGVRVMMQVVHVFVANLDLAKKR